MPPLTRRAFLQTLGGSAGLLLLTAPYHAAATPHPPAPVEIPPDLSWEMLLEAFGALPDIDPSWQQRHEATVGMHLRIYDTEGRLVAQLVRCRYDERGPIWRCRFVGESLLPRVRRVVLQHAVRAAGSAGRHGAFRVGDPVTPRSWIQACTGEPGVCQREEVVGGRHSGAAVADDVGLRSAA